MIVNLIRKQHQSVTVQTRVVTLDTEVFKTCTLYPFTGETEKEFVEYLEQHREDEEFLAQFQDEVFDELEVLRYDGEMNEEAYNSAWDGEDAWIELV